MDNFLAGDSSLMDGTSDLPLLQLPLLPLPDHCVLSPGPVVGPYQTDTASPSVSVSADVSRRVHVMYSGLHCIRGTFPWC